MQSDLNSQKYSNEEFNSMTKNDGTCLRKPRRLKW